MEAIGPVLVLLSIPLMFRWIPRNPIYGFRIPATMRSDSVWYDANALAARHMFVLGLVLVLLEFVVSVSSRLQMLRIAAIVAFVGIIVMDCRTANRWDRERRGSAGPVGSPPSSGPRRDNAP